MKNFQVGGSLNANDTNYITRAADTQLYETLLQGEFCYVFNCRQMGKSSLRVRVKNRLEQQGYACVSLDMTNIGSNSISLNQWYKSIASEIWRGFGLMGKVKFKDCWAKQQELSPIQQLNRFVSDVILPTVKAEKLFIFIDEIDSVISLDFSTDDFFALIRYFYNQRAEDPEYKRLSFALFGVAIPSDLISDRNRTPFNIGRAIELTGFTPSEATPLIRGLQDRFINPQIIMEAIINWTGGQPFLTQKVCQLAVDCTQRACDCPLPGEEAEWVKNLVNDNIIDSWEFHDEPEHLKTIRDRLLRDERKAPRLLRLVEEIFRYGFIPADNSPEQKDLLLSNLAIKQNGQLVGRNLIYQKVFNFNWLEQQQYRLRPFGQELKFWLAFKGLDRSSLLRGQALQQAQIWAGDRNISQEEYQFLTASQEQEQEELRQKLELEKLREVEAKLIAQKQSAKKQTWLNITLSLALGVSSLLSLFAYQQFKRAVAGERLSNLNEIKARTSSANALLASNRQLDALIEVIQAKQKLNSIEQDQDNSKVLNLVDDALLQAIQGTTEYNRLLSHTSEVWGAVYSPDGETIVSTGADSTVRLWNDRGKLLGILKGHSKVVRSVTFSNDGETIASGGDDRTIRLWNARGEALNILRGHRATIRHLSFNPQGDILASGSDDGTVKLWNKQGQNILTVKAHDVSVRSVAFSPDGKTIASSSEDNTIALWNLQGEKLKTLRGHTAAVLSVVFSPDNNFIVSGGEDNTVKIWNAKGEVLQTIDAHDAPIRAISFSSQEQIFATASADHTIKLWNTQGLKLKTLTGHAATVRSVAFSPESDRLASASSDLSVKLWQVKNPNLTILNGHKSAVRNVAFSPKGDRVATASSDNTAILWDLNSKPLAILKGHQAKIAAVEFSPEQKIIATASFDNTVKLWNYQGREIITLKGHTAAVRSVAFSPKQKLVATASTDNTVRLWNYQGQNLKTFTGKQAGSRAVVFSPDGRYLASASDDGTIELWNFNSKQLTVLTTNQTPVLGLEFSPDGRYLASAGGDQTVKIWNLQGKLITTFIGHKTLVRDVAFSPDGRYLASAGGDGNVKIWNRQGEELSTWKSHSAAIRGVDFSPDGKYVASASEDGTAIVWNVRQLLELEPLTYACNWSKDYLKYNAEAEIKNICQ